MTDRADWYGRMPPATLPVWDNTFLEACQAAGSIVDCHPADRSALAVWSRLAGWATLAAAVIGGAWVLYLR